MMSGIKCLNNHETFKRSLLFILLIIVFMIPGCKNKESYRKEIEQKGITYSRATFMNEVTLGNKETIELFIKAGIGINTKDDNGNSALFYALAAGDIEIVKLLLEEGADIKDVGNGTPALVFASLTGDKGDIEKVKLLLEKGADVNVKSPGGVTALMCASGNTEIVKLLLEKGADVNAKTIY